MNSSAAIQLARYAAQARQWRQQAASTASLQVAMAQVKQFQAARLAHTHEDLLASARYQAAAQFFLHDLYGGKNVARRDDELARVIPVMQKFLPDSALSVMAAATQLDALSEQLDLGLAKQIEATLQPDQALSLEHYRSAYRAVHQSDPQAREQQMRLVTQVGSVLDTLVRKPLLNGLLKSMGPAASAAGFDHMHDFLSRGFAAFKQMNGASEFLQTVQLRERAYHEQLI